MKNGIRGILPWLDLSLLDLRKKEVFKDNFARAICCTLPVFDLVIIDEGHNLKHGFREGGAARNRVLAYAFGTRKEAADTVLKGYGPRAKKVLFLSATPMEETYRHLYNQLELMGKEKGYGILTDDKADEEEQKKVVRRFLIRRVTAMKLGGRTLTKNLYRREWREGGVAVHDKPMEVTDPRKRLTVALVQKKVSEILGSGTFNNTFQIGMLASFESFLQTAKLKRTEDEDSVFDDSQEVRSDEEKEGIDVGNLNRLATSHRREFGREMPHPKMDAIVDALKNVWNKGEKALVFVRRIKSVDEIRTKLNEQYDEWLIKRLREELPIEVKTTFDMVVERYGNERIVKDEYSLLKREEGEDKGGRDNFFAWYFRGEGPKSVVSGASINKRFGSLDGNYWAFFEDNDVAGVLACRPSEVVERVQKLLGSEWEEKIREAATNYMPKAKKQSRRTMFEAVQAATLEIMMVTDDELGVRARRVWNEKYQYLKKNPSARPSDVAQWLSLETFFTELRLHEELRKCVWPESTLPEPVERYREQEVRRTLLSAAARLGHAFLDLYIMMIRRLKSLERGAREETESEEETQGLTAIREYVLLLDGQRLAKSPGCSWRAYDELESIARHYELIVDVNANEIINQPLPEVARSIGNMMGKQEPIAGMSGQVNKSTVRQFRMPGYPLVLVTTELLQEGEDLHTFCASLYHYGISWTPSSMEQRVGRIDRVRSLTERRLQGLNGKHCGEDLLQVYYPYLGDSVEILQVRRVLSRINRFLRLMHESLASAGDERRAIDTSIEMLQKDLDIRPIEVELKSAFPVDPSCCRGEVQALLIRGEQVDAYKRRFAAIRDAKQDVVKIDWDLKSHTDPGILLGTAHLNGRVQPFTLLLESYGPGLFVRCISPIGQIQFRGKSEEITDRYCVLNARLGAIPTEEKRTYDLTVERGVLLADEKYDTIRIYGLIAHIVRNADRLEREILDVDRPLDDFRGDLVQEGNRES
jgi:hypothetical protein